MYIFILMLLEYYETGNLHWFVLFYLFILIRWAIVFAAALRYRPYTCQPAEGYVSVLIPVLDEDPVFFAGVLRRIAAQRPDEILVVINGEDRCGLAETVRGTVADLQMRADVSQTAAIRLFHTPEAGKRNAIRIGVENLNPQSEFAVLVDSDVLWTEDTLRNLLRPFAADGQIAGVTTRQKIHKPERSLVAMVCAVLEEIRAEGTMKAMSATGKIGCLSGRTIAFRSSFLRESMAEFMTERFLGIHKEVSDDRSLTNLALRRGFKTVMQDTSVVYTEPPLSWRKFARQQLRWAEGSQYSSLRMTGWMLRNAPLMLFIYWSDMLMPFLLYSVYANALLCAVATLVFGFVIEMAHYLLPLWKMLVMLLLGEILGFGLRNLRAFRNLPLYCLFLAPALTLVLSLFLAPIRILGLMRCADELSWDTRNTASGEWGEVTEGAYIVAGGSRRAAGGAEAAEAGGR